ncbi:MAG: protein-L-isoaspartate(D-aspartate) O-methyltransferase [Hyphomicrobiales bacterium]
MAVGNRILDAAPPGDMAQRREQMVERQIESRGIGDRRVLDAMREVPREAFVAPDLAEFAYEDTPLPIAEGQTISQPYIVGLMTEAVEPGPGQRILDVGTGSGYAAAILSRIADRVLSIERHPKLVEDARKVFEYLDYRNIEVRLGDGSLGAPEEAPFDAILVAAGAPEVPAALLEQLAPGGGLVIPVGEEERRQHLMRVRKDPNGELVYEDLGAARFVPLIGSQGWTDPEAKQVARAAQSMAAKRAAPIGETDTPGDLSAAIARHAEPLPALDDPAFGQLFDRLGDSRVVLLGEATHGTSEFYRARAAITRRLIEEYGFTIVAVEADWPDAAGIDRYVRGLSGQRPEEAPFARFPTWMWRNTDVRDFVDWLHDHNAGINESARQVSFHGLDLYSLNASIRAVLDYLDRVDPQAAEVARERYGCLSPWQRDPTTYGRAGSTRGFKACEQAVVKVLQDLLEKRLDYAARDGESFVDATQNARLVAAAQHYYRAIYHGSALSWNLRDKHMFETLVAMMRARDAKAVVWAHNSHVGNAAATEMGSVREEFNIGQLCREEFGRDAALVGFGTDRGTVAAASNWDAPMEVKTVRPALDGSYEATCRDAGSASANYLLDLRPEVHEDLRELIALPRLERAIGVIYRPETELASHYFEASLAEQFDHYIWMEETNAVQPLKVEDVKGAPDTYPFGL